MFEDLFRFEKTYICGRKLFNPFSENNNPLSSDLISEAHDISSLDFKSDTSFIVGQNFARPSFTKAQIEKQLKGDLNTQNCEANKSFIKKLVLANPSQAADELVQNKEVNIEWRLYTLSLLSFGWYQNFAKLALDKNSYFHKSIHDLAEEGFYYDLGNKEFRTQFISTGLGDDDDVAQDMLSRAIDSNAELIIKLIQEIAPDLEKYISDSIQDPKLINFFLQKTPFNENIIDHKIKTLFIAALIDTKAKSNLEILSGDYLFIVHLMNDILRHSSILVEDKTTDTVGGHESLRISISRITPPSNSELVASVFHELEHQISKRQLGLRPGIGRSSYPLTEFASFMAEIERASFFDKEYPEQFKQSWKLDEIYSQIHKEQNGFTADPHRKALSLIKNILDLESKYPSIKLLELFKEELKNELYECPKPLPEVDFDNFLGCIVARVNERLQESNIKLGLGIMAGDLTEEIKIKVRRNSSPPESLSSKIHYDEWTSKVPIIFEQE